MRTFRMVAFVAALLVVPQLTGCGRMLSCIMSQVVDAEIVGPFVDPPGLRDFDQPADQITTATTQIYFLWAHPDIQEGDTFACRIMTVDVEGFEPDAEMGMSEGTVGSNMNLGGQIGFATPSAGWAAGTFRAEMLLNGEVFDSVEFVIID